MPKNVQLPALIMSNCSYLTGFPNGVLMLATAPAAEDGAAAPAADAPADGKHYCYYKQVLPIMTFPICEKETS